LKYLAKLNNVISENGKGSQQWQAAVITGGETPTIKDALEILKYLAKLPNIVNLT